MNLPFEEASRLLATVVSPRPLAWITSWAAVGDPVNIAPFNSYTGLANNPPLVGISFSRRLGASKDTLANIEATGEFVLNVVTLALAESMNDSAREAGRGIDDFLRLGLESLPIEGVSIPRIAAAPAALACKLESIIALPPSNCRLVVGRLVGAYVAQDYDPEASHVLASVGPLRYATMTGTFSMPKTWS